MTDSNKNDRAKLIAAVIGLVAALLMTAWLLGFFERDDIFSDDPQVAELQRAMQQPKEKQDIKLLKQEYMELSPAQQQEFDKRKMLMYLPEQEEKLRSFFSLSEEEQWEQIDREIDAGEEKRRRYRSQVAGKDQSSKQQSPGAAAKAKGKRAGGMNPERIMAGKQAWTANASPELRSMMDRRIRMINERRKQRGLPPL